MNKDGKEIERRFLASDNGIDWRSQATVVMELAQCYPVNIPELAVRIATREGRRTDGTLHQSSTLTIKSPRDGLVRNETEIAFDFESGVTMLASLSKQFPILRKTRWHVPHAYLEGLKWEVDQFHDLGRQLLIAEIELPYADFDIHSHLPEWVGTEVTDNPAYYSANLVRELQDLNDGLGYLPIG